MALEYDHALTTVDNPYDPFEQWAEWFQFDTSAGYGSASLLARITQTSYALSEPDQRLSIEQAIDEIVLINASGMHKKVSRVRED